MHWLRGRHQDWPGRKAASHGEALMASSFSTADVAPGSQLDYWREAVSSTFFMLDVDRVEHSRTGFHAEMTTQSLGRMLIATVSSEPHAVVRSPRIIRQSDADDFVVNLATHGR